MQREGEVEGSRGRVQQGLHGSQGPGSCRHVERVVAEGVLLVRVLGTRLRKPFKSLKRPLKAYEIEDLEAF